MSSSHFTTEQVFECFGAHLPIALRNTSYHDDGAVHLDCAVRSAAEQKPIAPSFFGELLRQSLHDQITRFLLDLARIVHRAIRALVGKGKLTRRDRRAIRELRDEIVAEIVASPRCFDTRTNTSTLSWLTAFSRPIVERWHAHRFAVRAPGLSW